MGAARDSTLTDAERRIADLERQLADCRTERNEALQRETAAAEVLQVINSSPGNLAPVFDAILERAHTLCGAVQGAMFLLDGEHLRAVATRGMPEAFNSRMRAGYRAGDFSLTQPLLAGQPFNHIADLAQLDHPVARAAVELTGARTVLAVALRKDNVLLGQIVNARREVRPFSDKEIALLQNFAVQAVIAMENARLITETREALEQQTATAEVLGVINSSPGHLAPVFEAMLEKAMRLCESDFGILWKFDGGRAEAGALHQVPEAYAKLVREPFEPSPGSGPARMMRGDRTLVVADLLDYPPYQAGDTLVRAIVDRAKARSVVIVPLRNDAGTIGAITIYRTEVRPFSEKQVAILESFAAQAVIAMESARLLTETREALERQTATAEVLQVINASPGNLTPVFDAILEKAHRICSLTRGSLVTYAGSNFTNVARRGVGEQVAAVMSQARSVPWTAQRALLRGDRHVHIPDLSAYSWDPDDTVMPRYMEALNLHAGLLVPLRKDDVLLGYISGYRDEAGPFSEKEIALLENFAGQAVIAMENARLITETREALEQQTATAEVLGVINSSPGDLAPVFGAVLEKALRLCGAGFGVLGVTRDGESFGTVACQGPPALLEFFRDRPPRPPAPGSTMRRLLDGEASAQELDLMASALYAQGDPTRRALVDLGACRSLASVAMRKDGAVLGALHIYRQEVSPFSDKEIALLQNFAAQAVIAMENARLLGELRHRTEEVAELNRGLEARVAEQVEELGRVGRLKRFLAPQLAELIVSQGDEKILESHRREIVVVFCDLRGYTAFTETAEPEEVLDFLREYHGALGPLVSRFEGTLDQFSGDGIMVFFNDPVPIPEPAERAVNMAVAMREAASTLIAAWRERGRELGFGAGIAQGYATLGQIGFSERSGYTAIGTVCNVAARLCAEAKDGQILLGQRVNVALKGTIATEQVGALTLKGLTQPVVAYNVPLAAGQPTLRVIEGGPQTPV